MTELNIAVVGALGAVGREMLKTLAQRRFPAKTVKALDIAENVGKTIPFNDGNISVELCCKDAFRMLMWPSSR